MYLHESRLTTIVLIEIGQTATIPTLKSKVIPIDIIENIIMVQIEHYHIMSVRPYFPCTFFRVFNDNLHICFSISVCIYPVDNQISLTSVNTIPVTVNQQAVVYHITFQVTFLHIAIIVQPQDRDVIVGNGLYGIRLAVSVQIQVLRFITNRWRRETQWG